MAGVERMHGPTPTGTVTVVVPQREQFQARVDDSGATWVDLMLLTPPRTAWTSLTRVQVAVQFTSSQGLYRMLGQLDHRPQDAGLRAVGCGSGEILRFTHRGTSQLLRTPALVVAPASARIVVLRAGAYDHVAVEGRCVTVGGGGLRVAGLPFAGVGQFFDFDLFLIPHEPAISGRFQVTRVEPDGIVNTQLTQIPASERRRLLEWAAKHGVRKVA